MAYSAHLSLWFHLSLAFNVLVLQINVENGVISPQPNQRGFIPPPPQIRLLVLRASQSPLSAGSHQTRCQSIPIWAGTLTFSSPYLMAGFICQTNVKNTIPQAQSLWQCSQLFLVRHPLTLREGRVELPVAYPPYASCQSKGGSEEGLKLT